MKLNEILSSAQAQAEIEKLQRTQDELKASIEQRGIDFQTVADEERDAFLNETEEMKKQFIANKEILEKLNERMSQLKEEEEKMTIIKHEPTDPTNRDVTATKEYRDLWINVLKGNAELSELRAGIKTSDDGVPVPTIMQQYVETAWEKYGHIANLVTKSYFKGILSVPYEDETDDASYHAEGATAPTEESVTLGEVLLQPVMIKKWISITDEVKALTGDEFLKYVADEVIYKIAKFLDDQIVSGEGSSSKGVIGVTASDLTESITSGIDANTVNVALGSLGDRANNPVVIMNKKTFFSDFLGLKDSTGRPIYNIVSDNEGRARYFLNGIPVVFSSALKDFATTAETTGAYMIVGDMSAYRLNLPEGDNVVMLHDIYTLATQDMERIIGRLFAAGDVVRPHSLIKVLKPKTTPEA